jgi:hypothetical protein
MKKDKIGTICLLMVLSINIFASERSIGQKDEVTQKKSIGKMITTPNFEPNGWYFGKDLFYFIVPANDMPNEKNIHAIIAMREPGVPGIPSTHKMQFGVDFATGARSVVKLSDIDAMRMQKKYHAEVYLNLENGVDSNVDVYFCASLCAKENSYIDGIKVTSEEIPIILWGRSYEASSFFSDPDLRAGGFPTLFRASDSCGQSLWEWIYLLKTEGAIENNVGNRFASDIVITPSFVSYMMPGDQYFYLGANGVTSVRYSNLIQKISVLNGWPVKKNPQLVPVLVHEFRALLHEVEVAVERHYVRQDVDGYEQYHFIHQKEDVPRRFKWSGELESDVMGYLDFTIQQRWFKK